MANLTVLPLFSKILCAFPAFFTRTFLVRIRLLPITIFFAALMFAVRIQDIKRSVTEGSGISMASAWAQGDGAPAATSAPPADTKHTASKEKIGTAAESKLPTETFDPLSMTKEEIDVLQHLSTKQDAMNKKHQDLTHKETLLTTVEKRVDDKLKTLQDYKQAIEGLIKKKEKLDSEQIKGLVKIYESMKPQEAATILEGMDNIDIVLSVVSAMKEAKASMILAKMKPESARALTVRLADRNRGSSADQKMLK